MSAVSTSQIKFQCPLFILIFGTCLPTCLTCLPTCSTCLLTCLIDMPTYLLD
ncbi:hypothetical protein Hanom_Chr06g00540961 [Helianthus anomalus]